MEGAVQFNPLLNIALPFNLALTITTWVRAPRLSPTREIVVMSFGFSIGDIIAASRLAQEIYDNCFTRSQAADVKYVQFRQEIQSLGHSLKQLESILINAGNQRSRRPWHTDADHFGEALQVLPEVTGDFQKTLKDCERLLQDHARLGHGKASIAANLAWWTSTESDVNNLRERVNFHITKVSFIAKPFETQLLLEIRRELQLLRSDVAVIRGILTNGPSNDSSNGSYLQSVHISNELAIRFDSALGTNVPLAFTERTEWPVREGFDALVFHFAKSTVEFSSNRRLGQNVPDPRQYLNLLKSVWTMRQLRDSPRFQQTGSESLWADYMRELEADIRGQFHRFDAQQLVRPPINDLLRLPDEHYTIWVDEEPPLRSLELVEQRPLENKILELALPESYGTRQTSLTVFQKSEYEYRLVRTTKMIDNPLYHSEQGSNISMNSTRLIPAYATPDNASSVANNLALCNDRGEHEEWHLLRDASDVVALQRALTGYRIHHDMSNFSWCINGSREPEDWGTGRLQMWQLKPLPPIEPESEPRPLNRVFTDASQATAVNGNAVQAHGRSLDRRRSSGLSSTTTKPRAESSDVRSMGSSHTTLVSGTSMTASVNGPRGDGIELVRPEAPVLVIFTMCRGKYTFLHLKLEPHIFINPKSCACTKPKQECKRVVLESDSKKKPFILRKLSAEREKEQGLFSWDLAMFRYPHHPDFSHVPVVEKMKYLDLTFSSIAAKKEFISELAQLENVRNIDHNNYERYLRQRRMS